MSKIQNVNGATIVGPSDHGCGYAYAGGCACRDNVGYGPAEPSVDRMDLATRVG